MKIFLKQVPGLQEPEIEIKYSEIDNEIDSLVRYIQNNDSYIYGEENGRKCKLRASTIYYIESVDKQTFIYTDKNVYHSSLRLYQLAGQLKRLDFVQISKSCILNLNMLEDIQTLKNSRLEATLLNGEKLHVSRTYIKKIKDALSAEGEHLV